MKITWEKPITKYDGLYIIYRLYNIITNKSYIGKTNKLSRRIRRYKNDSKTSGTYLYKAIRKYGINNFDIQIIDYGDKETINDLEYHYIFQYKTREYQNGYNLTDGGDGTINYIFTDKHKNNISKSLKGRIFTDEHRKKISESKKENYDKTNHPNYGKKLSNETRKR